MHKPTLFMTFAAASLAMSASATLVAQPAETPASENAATPAVPATPATSADAAGLGAVGLRGGLQPVAIERRIASRTAGLRGLDGIEARAAMVAAGTGGESAPPVESAGQWAVESLGSDGTDRSLARMRAKECRSSGPKAIRTAIEYSRVDSRMRSLRKFAMSANPLRGRNVTQGTSRRQENSALRYRIPVDRLPFARHET